MSCTKKNFTGTDGGSGDVIIGLSDSLIAVKSNGPFALIDTNGYFYDYKTLYFRYTKTIRCATGIPYVFKDGSSLNISYDDNWGIPCPIYQPPDTFPGRHIIKIKPNGRWDSTFVPDANAAPRGFAPYDSNRIFIYGNPFQFTHYNGKRVNGLCRIYLDGTLDTTFTSPISDTLVFANSFLPHKAEKDGDFFITGNFLLKEAPKQFNSLARFNADGSLDTTFMNFSGPKDTANPSLTATTSVVQTEDNGYLVGGLFNSYQGYAKNCIAKIDSNGKVEPQYFTGEGPDSAILNKQKFIVIVGKILKSKFGGYYIGGNFQRWDCKPVQPIVRLKLVNNTGIGEKKEKATIKIYPNPLKERLYVELQQPGAIEELQLLSARGNLLRKEQYAKDKRNIYLHLSQLPSGIYFLRLKLKSGALVNKKIIKL